MIRVVAAVVVAVALGVPPLPAGPLAMWSDYRAAVTVAANLQTLHATNGPYSVPAAVGTPARAVPAGTGDPVAANGDVERWRPLIADHFPPGRVDEALRVVWCESRGNPSAVGAANDTGLFQFIPDTWAAFGDGDPTDPAANVAAAARLVEHSITIGLSPWHHWTCKP